MSRWTIGLVLVAGLVGCGQVDGEADAGDVENDSTASATAGAGGSGNDNPSGTGGSISSCGAGPLPYGTAGGGPIPDVGTAGGGPLPGTGGSAGAPGIFAPMCEKIRYDFRSDCSFEETCTQIGCGDGISRFDAQGCLRECQTSADCGAGERCRYTTLALELECGAPSEVEACSKEEDGSCSCSVTADCGFADICVDAEEYPAELDCDVSHVTCGNSIDLMEFRLPIAEHGEPGSVRHAELGVCREKVMMKLFQLGCPYEEPVQP